MRGGATCREGPKSEVGANKSQFGPTPKIGRNPSVSGALPNDCTARVIRYLGLAWLGIQLGSSAMGSLRRHSWGLAGTALAVAVLVTIFKRYQATGGSDNVRNPAAIFAIRREPSTSAAAADSRELIGGRLV